jgi:hypothetical protein
MDIHLLRKDDPLESGAIYQYITVQARARKVAASDILEAALIFLRCPTLTTNNMLYQSNFQSSVN